MTKKQIEKKAKEMANKYPEVGYNSRYHREIYAAAMKMAEWLLAQIKGSKGIKAKIELIEQEYAGIANDYALDYDGREFDIAEDASCDGAEWVLSQLKEGGEK